LATSTQAIITEAFQNNGIVAEGRQPTPTQMANGLTVLNDNLLTQMVDGWHDLGWFPQVIGNITNNAPLHDEDIGDVKLCLTAWIAQKYGRTIDPNPLPDPNGISLYSQIENAFRRLNKRYLRNTECDLGELSRPQGGPWGGPNYFM
jgi:hypothetical protein